MTELVYTTVETVSNALDITETATQGPQILRAIAGATSAVYGITKRFFFPAHTTVKFDWPNRQTAETWRVWFYANDLWSLTAVTAGGVSIPTANIILEPNWEGPPYTSAQIDLSTGSSFSAGNTFQQALAFTGLWGKLGEVDQVATLTAAVTTTTATTLTATGSAALGVGATIGIDDEILAITGKQSAATSVTLSAPGLTADEAVTLIPVSSTTGFAVGETITIGAERMQITDITSGLVVRRAVQGSVLATHTTGDTVYASRLWTVARGLQGSVAATHLNNAPITRYYAPTLVENYTIAHAMHTLQQEKSAYMTLSRSGPEGGSKAVTSAGLERLKDDLYGTFGRQARTRVV